MLETAEELDITRFYNPNGLMMESENGGAYSDMLVRIGRRHSLYHAYVEPVLHRRNLTILTQSLARRILFNGNRATGVEIARAGEILSIKGSREATRKREPLRTPQDLTLIGHR
jgi:choline dehydrogenase